MRRPSARLFALLALTGCGAVQADGRPPGVRCLAFEPDMTVSSPFDPGYTQGLIDEVRRSLRAIEEALEVECPSTLRVEFETVEMPEVRMTQLPDGSFDVEGFRTPTLHGYRGYAAFDPDAPKIKVYMAPEGKATLHGGGEASAILQIDSDSLIRHELAHIGVHLAGLDGPTWFNEGVAEEFEAREFDATGELVPVEMPASMQRALARYDDYSLRDVLEWNEDFRAASTGDEKVFRMGRPLALALLRFLLQRAPETGFRARLEWIRALSDDRVLALEGEWRAWMEALR